MGNTTVPWAPPGSQREFMLRLQDTGSRFDGYLVAQIASNSILTGNLTGTLQADHLLVLEGTTPAAGSNDQGVTFRVTIWFAGGAMQGTVDYDAAGGYLRREVTHGTLTLATKNPDPADTFQGTWRGRYLVRTCELIEWRDCLPTAVGQTADVELTLSQSGSVVTGTLWPDYSAGAQPGYQYVIEVTGEVTGGTLRLSGVSPPYPNNKNETRRLMTFAATRDSIGHLAGTFDWQDDYVGSGPANLGMLYRRTRSGNLYAVIQVR